MGLPAALCALPQQMSLLFVEHGVRDMMNDSEAIVPSDQSHAAMLFNIPLLGLQGAECGQGRQLCR
jgi:hypothetical protein